MADLHRRSFLRSLAASFGAASMPDLRARILDKGSPILLKPTLISNQIFVAENGALALGDEWDFRTAKRPSWKQYFADMGAETSADLAGFAADWEVDDIDALIDDENWPGIFDMHYEPPAAAYQYLRQLDIGPKSLAKRPRNGRLDYFAGSNHVGSSDLWVEAYDDLSVSLLQARLIELKQPIELVMECEGSICKLDDFDHDAEPADE